MQRIAGLIEVDRREPEQVESCFDQFLIYDETTQRTCLRLMGRKMLVALMMEGKFSGEGIHSVDADDDLLAAIGRRPGRRADAHRHVQRTLGPIPCTDARPGARSIEAKAQEEGGVHLAFRLCRRRPAATLRMRRRAEQRAASHRFITHGQNRGTAKSTGCEASRSMAALRGSSSANPLLTLLSREDPHS